MSPAHSCDALPNPRRRTLVRLWPLALGALLLAAALQGWRHLPPTWRIQLDHEAVSFLTDAPVLLLGDSITYANGPLALCDAAVFNAAVPGARLKDVLSQGPRLAERVQPTQIVVAIGVNDAIMPHGSIEDWSAQYRSLVTALPASDLVLVEINPVDARFPLVARSFDQDFIARQNRVIRETAARSGARLVPAPAAAETFDGLHPDHAGAALWRARLTREACGR
ncbi:SGNH/GDSL hydrolase family protein [Xanthobacter sp. V4C-4]|uniref:SGNH/GDSL hydrolase family protein n=1 Tax=Xanthobacter cornucopiae TaxID=3119924 RepID=UPI003728EE81